MAAWQQGNQKGHVVAGELTALWRRVRAGEALSRGVRAFAALASVSLAGWWLGQVQAVIPLLLGVIAGALAETDDSWRGQVRAQCATLLCFAVMALGVQACLPYPALLMALLGLSAFGLTMLGALGERYRALASATLILAIYTALASAPAAALLPDAPIPPAQRPVLMLLAGAGWYGVISVLWAAALPMLPVQQHLARLYALLGTCLRLKSRLLEPVRGLDLERRTLALALHNGEVVEGLNGVKESLFSRTGRDEAPDGLAAALHLYLVAQDAHERVSSSHGHYGVLTDAFFHSDVLYRCQRVLALLGHDCHALAQALAHPGAAIDSSDAALALEDLHAAVRHAEAQPRTPEEAVEAQGPLRALRALAKNLDALAQVLASAVSPVTRQLPADSSLLDRHARTPADAWRRVRAQLRLSSPLMRHALRMGVALVAGHALMLYTGDSHGYWILLTIVFVCQPYYGATLTRLAQRVWGTVLGLVVGWALLRLFPDVGVQSAFTVAAGAVFFWARSSRYTLATAAITSLVLLSFNQAGDGFGLIVPRLLDTLAGGLIAGLAVWLVLPSWHSRRLHHAAAQAVATQASYLRAIAAQYGTGKHDHLAYRLARRNAHNADAALSGAMAAVFKEPVYVRRHAATGTRFLALSHTLLSYLSALGAHRNARLALADDAAAGRALASLLGTLDAMAEALDAGRQLPRALPAGGALLEDLLTTGGNAAEPEDAGDLVRALLALALGLLPQLWAEAADLVDAPRAAAAPAVRSVAQGR
ncbi:MAG: family rane protein [Polaromonas sp.]|nr:family rane protein [Polaromonas sp.]